MDSVCSNIIRRQYLYDVFNYLECFIFFILYLYSNVKKKSC
jgi:hypothetical protein